MFLRFLTKRLLYVIPMLFITTFIVFSFILLIPGDPALAILGENASDENLAQLRAQLGLDQSLLVQYWNWLTSALVGDLGESFFTGESVQEAVFSRMGITFQLVTTAIVIAFVFGTTLAIVSMMKPGSWIDEFARLVSTMGTAIPNFLLAMLLLAVFSLSLGWLPATGFISLFDDPIGFVRSVLLPSIALGAVGMAQITRHMRSALIEVFETDYIRTAFSKGLSVRQTIFHHGIRNAILPVVTTVGILYGNLMGATVVVETIFSIPGIGQLAVDSIMQRDFAMLQGVVLVMVVIIIVINFATDIIYSLLDPRIKYE
ncbi:ABC transporter permease [Geomicrobium sediminis]|uniref:Peptide/nickel transport system permease protein n=1 Tax=Geomicrobium sediminis TaxID=1347788 RepID=A0ABS2PDJ5_9BACL|nr:ABC transporter permease [Geomicrobium sediminis]MBM7632878.1 peptide/nickel transport system permease protein [Geomicrobium sediminis]